MTATSTRNDADTVAAQAHACRCAQAYKRSAASMASVLPRLARRLFTHFGMNRLLGTLALSVSVTCVLIVSSGRLPNAGSSRCFKANVGASLDHLVRRSRRPVRLVLLLLFFGYGRIEELDDGPGGVGVEWRGL